MLTSLADVLPARYNKLIQLPAIRALKTVNHTMEESGGSSWRSETYFLLRYCDEIIHRTVVRFCIWTTGRQLKQYPGAYITQPSEGHSRKGLRVWIDVNGDRCICMLAGWLAGSQSRPTPDLGSMRERWGERARARLGPSLGTVVVFEQIHTRMHAHTNGELSKESLFSCRSFVSQ